jgi:hypothetical protein
MKSKQEGIFLYLMLVIAYVGYCFDRKLISLVGKAIGLAGFTPGDAAPRQKELLWECGLASEHKSLDLFVFLDYVHSIIKRGFIPVSLRPQA